MMVVVFILLVIMDLLGQLHLPIIVVMVEVNLALGLVTLMTKKKLQA
jgi:hypothetical protein